LGTFDFARTLGLLGLGRGDGLEDAEQAFGVGAIHPLCTACRRNTKGGGNLPPPFGQLGVTTAQVFHVALWLRRIGQHTHHVNNGKPPFFVVPNAANGGFLEYRDVVRGFFWES
jgi:hypothetical protein